MLMRTHMDRMSRCKMESACVELLISGGVDDEALTVLTIPVGTNCLEALAPLKSTGQKYVWERTPHDQNSRRRNRSAAARFTSADAGSLARGRRLWRRYALDVGSL